MTTGFVVGKFYPFHLGHMYLIDVAQANCDRLVVWICDKSSQSIRGLVRACWIREMYPNIEVAVVPDTLDDNDSKGWAKFALHGLGKAPDVVFTSEDYGEVFAKLLGSRHVLVDRKRVSVPVSGSAIRNDPYGNWQYLPPPVRAHYAKRIVCVGAESTGTTTLAELLAEHYQTVWVPEYGREYYLRKQATGDIVWQTEEFVHIATEQSRREDEAARSANRLLITDTDAFATTLWHERYLNFLSPQVQRIANARKCDLYLLTGDEIPFVQDGARDGEHIRHQMHRRFEQELTRQGKRYMLVHGNVQERMSMSIAAIDHLFQVAP